MKSTNWGQERMNRVYAAYAFWRSTHIGVKSELYLSATEDAGMWTACVRIFPKVDTVYGPVGRSNWLPGITPIQTVGWDAPDFSSIQSDWAPTKEDCRDRAVADFVYECEKFLHVR